MNTRQTYLFLTLCFLALVFLGTAVVFNFKVETSLVIVFGVASLFLALFSPGISLYLLIFSMLLSPQIAVGQTSAREITVRLEDMLLAIILLGWLAKTAVNKELGIILKTPLNRPIFFYLLICVLATAKGIVLGYANWTSGAFFLLKIVEYFLLYFMSVNIIKNYGQAKNMLFAILAVAVLVSFYGIFQIPQEIRVSAPFEATGEPGTLGGYLVLVMSVALGLALEVNGIKRKILYFSLIPLAFIPLLFTLSRGSWLAGLGAVSAILVLSGKRVIISLVLIFAVSASSFFLPENVSERFFETFKEERSYSKTFKVGTLSFDQSTSERIEKFRIIIEKWQSEPLLGYGITGLGFTDGQYFRVLSETGLAGLFAFLWIIFLIMKNSYKRFREEESSFNRGFYMGFLAGTVGLLFHALGANTFLIVRIMEPFWFLCAISYHLSSSKNHVKPDIDLLPGKA